MKSRFVVVAVLGLTLGLAGCGSASTTPGDGDAGAVTGAPGPDTPIDDESPGQAGDNGLLAKATGDSPFFLDTVEVRVAESFPVQLFLDVTGDAPTPGHTVAYTVQVAGDAIAVEITTQSGEGASAAVLQPHRFAIPLGPAELPVTISVNDGEWTSTVSP